MLRKKLGTLRGVPGCNIVFYCLRDCHLHHRVRPISGAAPCRDTMLILCLRWVPRNRPEEGQSRNTRTRMIDFALQQTGMLIGGQCRLATIQFATWLLWSERVYARQCRTQQVLAPPELGYRFGGNAKPGDNAAGTERDTTGRCRVDQGASATRPCRNGNEPQLFRFTPLHRAVASHARHPPRPYHKRPRSRPPFPSPSIQVPKTKATPPFSVH
jgi:hypothetical protein